MKNPLLFAPILAITSALPAQALEFGDGFYTNGEFELEYVDGSGGGSGETLGYSSVDIGYQQPAGGFGAFVGFDAIAIDGANEIAVYGAISYSGGFGKLQFGVPRAVVDDYLDVPTVGGLRFIDVFLGNFSDSIITRAYLTTDVETPIGVRYDGAFGDLKLGASYHRIEDSDVIDLAVNYQMGDTLLRAGIEHLNSAGTDGTVFSLGAEARFGPVNAGVLLTDTGTVTDERVAKLYAVYSPMDQLNLTGTIWSVDDGTDTSTLYGLAAEYTFGQGAYVEAGIADASGGDSLYNLSLGLKF